MAGRKTRAYRTRSWFLLKGSVILVLIMCLFINNILIIGINANNNDDNNNNNDNKNNNYKNINENFITPSSNKIATTVTTIQKFTTQSIKKLENILITTKHDVNDTTIRATTTATTTTTTTSVTPFTRLIKTTNQLLNNNSNINNINNSSNNNNNNNKNINIVKDKNLSLFTNPYSSSNSFSSLYSSPISSSYSLSSIIPSTTSTFSISTSSTSAFPISTTISSQLSLSKADSSTLSIKEEKKFSNIKNNYNQNNNYNNNYNNNNNKNYNNRNSKFSSINSDFDLSKLRETVVIPSSDPELDAARLYEQSLKEYGVIEPIKSLRQICELWEKNFKCHCNGHIEQITLTCKGLGLHDVPSDMPEDVVILDLGNNNITKLPAEAFKSVPNLEELSLADNVLKVIHDDAFLGLHRLKRLSLQNCGLTVLPGDSFKGIPNLASLLLTGNALASMDSTSLRYLQNLRTLRLEGNLFNRIPTTALNGIKTLEALNLGSNLLTIISETDFPQMNKLVVLLLRRNQIHKISPEVFLNFPALKILELNDNLLNALPLGLNKLTHLQELSASGNRIKHINGSDLPKIGLQTLDLRANPITSISKTALQGLTILQKLILSDVRTLKDFPHLEGCISLETLRLDRAGLINIQHNLCKILPKLKSLVLKRNELRRIPDLGTCKDLRLLDISNNRIQGLSGKPFQGMQNLQDLLLSNNEIKSIPPDSFHGINRLQLLDLEGNEIIFIHDSAFSNFVQLEDLNLGNNMFPILPSSGLQGLLHLKTFNNPKLREFPLPKEFPKIQTLVLSYAYHCCPFLPLITSTVTQKKSLYYEKVYIPTKDELDMGFWNKSMTDLWPQFDNFSTKFGSQMHEIWDSFGQDFIYPGNLPTYIEEYFEDDDNNNNMHQQRPQSSDLPPSVSVQCLPLPGPFLPCTDLFDWWTLRCGVWIVFLLAMLGNGTVVFVLIFSKSKMDVPRFLVCNLAVADFFMGVYLGILAIVDAATLSQFRMYAIPWQMSVICQIAGFLAVLSSELSVYTLSVITLERNYAITNAIHLNKRLTLKQATYIMVFGWIFALTMAILPLVGISDYRKFAVCLPFETTTGLASLSYVVSLMFINGCAFLTLMGCYLKMYWAIRGSQAWNTNDSRIAKRMALLVFTDFLCWSPIAFFSLTAIFGLQLISLEQAKIFTVFILPLNSCCNPFLYAIMTKQFKKDCFTLCKTLEETRVSKTTAGRDGHRRGGGGGGGGGAGGTKELPPLLPNPHVGCRCLRMLPHEMPKWQKFPKKQNIFVRSWNRLVCKKKKKPETHRRKPARPDPYTYQFAEIKTKKSSRASSITSENFCSSRSSSWKNGPPNSHNCAIPLKIMDPNSRRRHSAWLITRKTSQDSTLSSSRNDSSASATTASTSTFRLSRSSASSTTPLPSIIGGISKQISLSSTSGISHQKPRLVRQQAVQEEDDDSSPPRLGVRFLPTIPSAADSSVVMEDETNQVAATAASAAAADQIISAHLYAVLQQDGNITKATISSPEDETDRQPP